MIECSFCFKKCKPYELRDADEFNKSNEALENLCPKCYEMHRKYYFQKNNFMNDFLEHWKKGHIPKNKGENTGLF